MSSRSRLRLRPVAAIAGLTVAVVAAGACGSPGRSGSGSGSPTASEATSTTVAFVVPTKTDLQAGLLTLTDAGEPFTNVDHSDNSGDSSAGTKPTGCPALDNNLTDTTGSGLVQVEADFDGGDTGPYFSEQLVSEPAAQFASDLAETIQGLQTCSSVSIDQSGTSITFKLTPVSDFGAGATATHMAGSSQGVSITGDIAVQRVGDAALFILDLQIGGATSVDAPTLFAKALQKAQSKLGS